MRRAVIYNMHAGRRGASDASVRESLEELQRLDTYAFWETAGPHDARRLGRRAAQEKMDRVIVAGGDGTVGQVVHGIVEAGGETAVGILPIGTGNDLARSLGLAALPLPDLVKRAHEGRPVPIDVVKFERSGEAAYFVNAASGGFGGRVAADVRPHDKERWGGYAYWLTAVAQLVRLEAFDARIVVDGTAHKHTIYGVEIANGCYVGGGFCVAPGAVLDDGLINVTVIPQMARGELLLAGLAFAMSRDLDRSHLHAYQGKRIEVITQPQMLYSIDGEPKEAATGRFEVLEKKLRVIAGPAPKLSSQGVPGEAGP